MNRVILSRISKAGGPRSSTMSERIRSGKYPDAIKREDGRWTLDHETAVQALADSKLKSQARPMPEIEKECGLQPHVLSQRCKSGNLKATQISGDWFMFPEEEQRVKNYYIGTVTTSEAAKIMGLAHRRSILNLIRRGFPFVTLGKERRIRKQDISCYLNGEMDSFDRNSKLKSFSKKLGFLLDWSKTRDEVWKSIFYNVNRNTDEHTIEIYCENKLVCKMKTDDFNRVFRGHTGASSLPIEWEGEINLVFHSFIETLFDNRKVLIG